MCCGDNEGVAGTSFSPWDFYSLSQGKVVEVEEILLGRGARLHAGPGGPAWLYKSEGRHSDA